ncbi:MAG TPA: hypothetical protein H9871_05665 [Candidatus Nesterenkonia stercoripullorum]|uniref:Uncharacterized protein n=1 Tax=Candidatus Nesterenkonia stercoripullorum TaxID=2838701 RepID=A0A9D1S212_9MICC|nr:hypothetical protein [Candidatus Nesterenkonia stercoripullorum]
MTRRVLMVGATGMLRPAVHALTHRGHSVTAVSRQPGRATPPSTIPGEFTAVSADWRDPESLTDAVADAAHGHLFPTAVVWVHSPYRVAVMRGLARLLTADAVVVQVWGSASHDPRDVLDSQGVDLPGRTMCHVMLGYVRLAGISRWLSSAEISDGVVHALDAAEPVHVVGRIDPWQQRP